MVADDRRRRKEENQKYQILLQIFSGRLQGWGRSPKKAPETAFKSFSSRKPLNSTLRHKYWPSTLKTNRMRRRGLNRNTTGWAFTEQGRGELTSCPLVSGREAGTGESLGTVSCQMVSAAWTSETQPTLPPAPPLPVCFFKITTITTANTYICSEKASYIESTVTVDVRDKAISKRPEIQQQEVAASELLAFR